jgi:valyl-tRNA synthetase
MIATWPQSDSDRQDAQIEDQFARFQEVLRAVREIRSRQNVAPRKQIDFSVRCDAETAKLLRPMEPYFLSMATARAVAWGPDVEAPTLFASVTSPGIEVFVDLAGLIDVEAETKRALKELERLESLIASKRKKLANENFLNRAPEAVVAKERDSLRDLEEQHATTTFVLERLGGQA